MKNTFSRVYCLLPVTGAALSFCLVSCSDSSSPATGNDRLTENTLIFHWKSDPNDMHPTNASTNSRRTVIDLTQRFIIAVDIEKQTLRPDLIKTMPSVSADELLYAFELRDSIAWDDGSPLTMDDILFTYKANICPYTDNPQAKPYFDFLDDVLPDAAHPMRFSMRMKQRYIQNLACLVDMPIMQRTFYDPQNVLAAYSIPQLHDPAFTQQPHPDVQQWAKTFNDPKYGHDLAFLQGLGPYKITVWDKNERMELQLKKNAPGGTPGTIYEKHYPEKIIMRFNIDDNAIGLELKKQEIDASGSLNTDLLFELQQDSAFNANYTSAFVDTYDYFYVGLNLKPAASNHKPFFTDKNVRRALALLTPVDDILQSCFRVKPRRVVSCISPLKAECSTDLAPVPYDPEQAARLLDAAGWTDTDGDNIRDKVIDGVKTPFVFELLLINQNPVGEKMVRQMQAAYYKAGINLKYRMLGGLVLSEKIASHDFDAYIGSWVNTFFPDDPKQIWHSSNWENGGSNFVGFGNAQSDRMIDSIRVTTNDAERNRILHRFQHLVYDEQPYVFLYAQQRRMVAHRRFENTAFYNDKPGLVLPNFRLKTP